LLFAFQIDYAYPKTNIAELLDLSVEQLMEIEVVVAASKFEQRLTEAPSAVTIITSDEIKKFGYRTLADLLKAVKGIYVSYDRNYYYAGIRGFNRPGDYNTRILLLVDGHRINNNIYEQAFIGNDFIVDIDLIDRVEIIRGPGSSLYGSNAFLGIINVITKSGKGLEGLEISGDAGSFKTYKGRLSYGYIDNKIDLLVSGTAYYSKGQDLFFEEFNTPEQNNGIADDLDYERANSAFLKTSFGDLVFQGAFVSRKKDIPTASFDTLFNTPGTYTIDKQWFLDIKYKYNFTNLSSIMARVFYDEYYYKGDYILEGMVKNKDLARGKWWGGEIQYLIKAFEKHKIILGTEYQNNFHQELHNFDENPFTLYIKDKMSSYILAFFIQDEFSILKNLILNAGIRYDYYSTFGSTTNPRFSLIYQPLKKTILKAIYGQAFRAPNVNELFFTDGLTIKANPHLQPERIKTYELILEQYIGNMTRLSASVFYYKIKDLIAQQADPVDGLLVFRNIDQVKAKGLEFEIEHKLKNGAMVKASHAYQVVKDETTKKIISNSPKNLSKFSLLYPAVMEKLFAGIEMQYMSKRKTLTNRDIKGFFLTNLTIYGSNLLKGLDASFSIYNLFDKKYYDPGAGEHRQDSLKQDGISFRFKLTYRF
jgi:iron complex outermembrane receptor protein